MTQTSGSITFETEHLAAAIARELHKLRTAEVDRPTLINDIAQSLPPYSGHADLTVTAAAKIDALRLLEGLERAGYEVVRRPIEQPDRSAGFFGG